MTREEIKRRAELYSVLAEGKIIQFKQENGEWVDLKTDLMCGIVESFRYRIKPEPKYRPFETQEECWNEMLKHQPFAFLSSANEYDCFSICRVFEEEGIPKITFASNPYSDYDMTKVFDTFQFADGTPFGIKEE